MKNLIRVMLCCAVCAVSAQAMKPAEARALFKDAATADTNTPYKPTSHPGAQWFPEAGFGLFIHWGMYSHAQVRPSWGILNNRFKQKFPRDIEVDEYYALAEKFNPQQYDPDSWMKLAKSLGMQYAVITTKHHDGYCLWPTEFGDYSTKNGANGRDLLKEYVDAARRHGLKVGFYFSPRDWGYNDHKGAFSVTMQKFDRDIPKEFPFPKKDNLKEYLKWIDFTVGQLSELLTQYGKIDVLWFDGANWAGQVPDNEYGNKVRNWIYQLQPQIVLNPRWGEVTNPDYDRNSSAELKKIASAAGDFYTFEANWKHIADPHLNAGVYEPIWFEFCDIWKGWSWGYEKPESKEADPARMHRTLERLSTLRAYGGNYLLNVGPDGDGLLREDIWAESEVLSKWLKPRLEAFIGVAPVKQWEKLGNVPMTRKGNTVYVHLTGESRAKLQTLALKLEAWPERATVLGQPEILVDAIRSEGKVLLSSSAGARDPLGGIIVLEFKENPIPSEK